METFAAFAIAFVITLFFVRNYLKGMSAAPQAAKTEVAVGPTRACPRCSKPLSAIASFCNHCGAPMALWTVHSAEVSSGAEVHSGKPRPVINATLCIGCGGCIDACPEHGTLALVGGKAILANPDRCVGHADCVTACPTNGITLAFGNVRQTLRVPLVRENFESNVPGLFIVGELGGMGLIKTSINEGRLVADHIRSRVEPSENDEVRDVIVIGAGPAGLSASLTLHQHGVHYLTLEQGEVASTIRQYPRHKFLMAEPIEMPLYGSLYIADSSKESLLAVWETIIANTGVRIQTNEKVEAVRRVDGALFEVTTPKGSYRSRFVILAIGKRGTPRRLGVPGEERGHVAYRLIEADSYEDRDITIVGGGDSAIEAAVAVAKSGRNRVALIHRGTDFNRSKDRNRKNLEEAEATGRIRILRQARVQEILDRQIRVDVNSATEEYAADYVFILIGGESPEDFLLKSGVEIVEKAIAA